MRRKIRIGALISGGGTNLQAIIDKCEAGDISGEMVFVGTDNPDAAGLKRAEKHGIPSFVVDYNSIIKSINREPDHANVPKDFDLGDVLEKQAFFHGPTTSEKVKTFFVSRSVAEAALLEKISSYGFDLLVLAGFMRNLTPYFIDRVNTDPSCPRIMNIHPALLPAFPGVDGYGDTFRYGCKVGGCTVHFIDYGEDSGPIIGQRSFDITSQDTLDTVKKKGLALEWELYPTCIQMFAEDRLEVVGITHTLDNGDVYKRRVVSIKS